MKEPIPWRFAVGDVVRVVDSSSTRWWGKYGVITMLGLYGAESEREYQVKLLGYVPWVEQDTFNWFAEERLRRAVWTFLGPVQPDQVRER